MAGKDFDIKTDVDVANSLPALNPHQPLSLISLAGETWQPLPLATAESPGQKSQVPDFRFPAKDKRFGKTYVHGHVFSWHTLSFFTSVNIFSWGEREGGFRG